MLFSYVGSNVLSRSESCGTLVQKAESQPGSHSHAFLVLWPWTSGDIDHHFLQTRRVVMCVLHLPQVVGGEHASAYAYWWVTCRRHATLHLLLGHRNMASSSSVCNYSGSVLQPTFYLEDHSWHMPQITSARLITDSSQVLLNMSRTFKS